MAAAQAGISLPGLMIVAGRDEDEPPHLRGDDDDIAEIASLEEVERLPRGHLVELGLIDARGALRVVAASGLDVLPARGPRRNDGDVEPDVLLAKIRMVLGSEGEVAVHGVQVMLPDWSASTHCMLSRVRTEGSRRIPGQ